MRLRVLGPVSVATDTGDDTPLRPQVRRLAALLLAADGRPVSGDRIADVLGATRTDGSAVRMAVSRLRSVFGERVETSPSGYRLVPLPDELDADAFESALREARTDTPRRRVDRLEGALALWRGDAFGDLAAEVWAIAVATRLDQERLGAVEDLAEALIACDRADDAVLLLQTDAEALRYRERSAGLLMEALAVSGRVTEALRAYQQFRRELVDDIGIEPTEALRQLEADLLADGGTVADRRPYRSARTAQSGNLVEPPSSLVGRTVELSSVVAPLGTHRVVSLVGPGGVGKTRLALAAAHTLRTSFPDGCWFVDLSALRTDDAVAPAMAGTLGVAIERVDQPVRSIVDGMRDRRALVVVDNCEHVLAGAREVVGALSASCPGVRVMATSREALGVPGELVHLLGPLDPADSVALFHTRAQEVNRHAEFGPDADEAVAQICRRVDGMPLSIELMAMRMRSNTAAEILQRFDDVHHDADFGPGRPDRQRTTHQVVDWSYRLLTEAQRTLFDRLSVFAGEFDLDAVVGVCEFGPLQPGSSRVLMDALVDKSLVVAAVRDRSTRYRLLDTMRHFGRDRLADGATGGSEESAALSERHVRHYEATAKQVSLLFFTDNARSLELLDGEWDNWRVAVRHCIAAGDVSAAARIIAFLWPTMVTFRAEIAGWVSEVRGRLPDGDPRASDMYHAEVQWALVLGEPERAILVARRGIELGLESTPLLWAATAEAESKTGHAAAGFAAALEALDALERSGNKWSSGQLLAIACRCAWAHEPSRVRGWAADLCVIAAQNGRLDDRARAAHAMGIAALIDGDPRTALAWFEEGKEVARDIGGLEAEAMVGVARATAALGGDDVEPAFLRALTVLRLHRNWMYGWVALENLMIHWVANGRMEDGAVLLGHLDAHGHAGSVEAPQRRVASEAVAADPQLSLFVHRGAMMRSPELLDFAIDRLASRSAVPPSSLTG